MYEDVVQILLISSKRPSCIVMVELLSVNYDIDLFLNYNQNEYQCCPVGFTLSDSGVRYIIARLPCRDNICRDNICRDNICRDSIILHNCPVARYG